MIKRKYQVTLYCTTDQYKPVSCIVILNQETEHNLLLSDRRKKEIIAKGIQKICAKRYWTQTDLKKYNYGKVKARIVEE